ncbi:MAG TPA: hypothetical protein VMF62_13465 [Acetobacteraceae bacterium]|nr:hypothetical protein [Acetobacteraceae bacterium]
MLTAFAPLPGPLAALGADLAALRPASDLAAALRTVAVPRIAEAEMLASLERAFAPLRAAAETVGALPNLSSLV